MRKFLSKILCALIRFYQVCISPLFPPCCRFYPTCSAYAMEAIQKYGPFKGFIMSVRRILRCNPFSKGGYDPVP
ncbi:MAG: membrane protein insertion efficiency factor YidD [Spirochaetaceae bacterium]|nr:membrane protein insertion efficiency factor YidD [Spirochaetaceae bacterium]